MRQWLLSLPLSVSTTGTPSSTAWLGLELGLGLGLGLEGASSRRWPAEPLRRSQAELVLGRQSYDLQGPGRQRCGLASRAASWTVLQRELLHQRHGGAVLALLEIDRVLHQLCSWHAHAVHMPCKRHAHAAHTPCTRHAHAVHTPCTRHAHPTHMAAPAPADGTSCVGAA